ncbi:MAG: molybdopterin molybdenumtransferase MoeA [Alphaproteobacteria bacterium]|jgi:molybdopterin molybdotransferase|nr:molybdopterin molybdenumtransferase MoeA [Alphaproteobacteria bacterium]
MAALSAGPAAAEAPPPGLASIEETRARALALAAPVAGGDSVTLAEARGRIADRDVAAPRCLPPFDHAAVDGYALGAAAEDGTYRLAGRLAAGTPAGDSPLRVGEAARIFTGAPVPPGTVAIAMQEHAGRAGDDLRLARTVAPGDNIRRAGEDVAAGGPLIAAGTRLDARHLAILAAAGLAVMPVRRRVRVALFSTGTELCEPGGDVSAGTVFDSNRAMLRALLADPAVAVSDLGILPDDRDSLVRALQAAAKSHDLLLSSGGVSVGEEDHVRPALRAAGGTVAAWQMAVKPGKPIAVGRLAEAVLIGLPGNPVAAFVDYLLIARPVIQALAGMAPAPLVALPAVAGFAWQRKPGRTEFFPAAVAGHDQAGLPVLERLGTGGAARLRPLTEAGGLSAVDRAADTVCPGDRLAWYPFASGFCL